MKILHIAPNAPYNDYWGYQDNLLPKYHKKMGHDVSIIVPNLTHRDGTIVKTDCADYFLNDGVHVIRLAYKKYFSSWLSSFGTKLDVLPYLEEMRPDFIFYHGLVSFTIFDIIRYKKKNPACVIVQDNHLDYNIGRAAKTFRDKLVRELYRALNRISIPYISRVYGVTPWRKTYAEDYFGIPKEKTDVLFMGADDQKIDFEHRGEIRKTIRAQHGVAEDDFLIVTGGKIDRNKKIHNLMNACAGMKKTKLLIFGQVADDVAETFDRICLENANIIFIGWIPSDEVYNYFFAADLVFFPGQHSVLWEQACAAKVPCVFQKWEGMEHVNNGGNSDFVFPVNEETIRQKILELRGTPRYHEMKKISESAATDVFLYSKIAERSLECAYIK